MSKPQIFVDRDRLSPRYIPSLLPHRENQINFLLSLYRDALEHIENVFLRVSQIVGGVGTGKTCVDIRFGELLEKEASERSINLQHVYLNCKIEGTSRFVLYGNMLRKVAPELSPCVVSIYNVGISLAYEGDQDRMLLQGFLRAWDCSL